MVALCVPSADIAFGAIVAAERPRVGHRVNYGGREYIVLAAKIDDAIESGHRTPPAAYQFQNIPRPPGAKWVFCTVIPDFHHASWPPIPLAIMGAQ